jgi:DNA-3-methyladenine glycosylase I
MSLADSQRCPWAGSDPLYVAYQDEEWGVPKKDARALFEKFVVEGCQAGLAWIIILRKREAFRAAFDNFDAETVARYGQRKVASLLKNEGIVRHRGKIEAAISNAKAFLELEFQASANSCGASSTACRSKMPIGEWPTFPPRRPRATPSPRF